MKILCFNTRLLAKPQNFCKATETVLSVTKCLVKNASRHEGFTQNCKRKLQLSRMHIWANLQYLSTFFKKITLENFQKMIAYVAIVFATILILPACTQNNAEETPMVIINDYIPNSFDSNNFANEPVSIIGLDQPVPRHIAAYMLSAIGITQTISQTEVFDDSEMLTLYQTWQIFNTLQPNGPNIYVAQANRDAYISYALWVDMFVKFLQNQTIKDTEFLDIIPLGTSSDGELLTNLGVFGGKRINLSAFFNQEIRILHKNNEILGAIGIVNFEPMLKNAIVSHSDAFGATITVGGVTRNFLFSEYVTPIELAEDQVFIANLQISGREIIKVNPATPPVPPYIRVAISARGFSGLVHDSIVITATGGFTVHGGEWYEIFEQGQHFTVSQTENTDLWTASRLFITPNCESYRLEILNLGRSWPDGQNPRYRGVFEIMRHSSGGFIIINELCLEEYLYAVIPSEMPASHGLEAAKVQAITARSFAMHQIYQNRFQEFGAHVCDSIISQVYNNRPETELSIQAVEATRGMVLMIGGEIVIANYFSTSGGTTANSGEVWQAAGQFPTSTPIHLQSHPQFYVNDFSPGNLREEKYANAFFRNHDIPAYDRQFPWFRWQTTLTTEQLTTSINANIRRIQMANPAMVQFVGEGDTTIDSIGKLRDIQVISRGQGGNIMEIMLIGTEVSVLVRTEFNIRTLLNPANTPVLRHDGSYVSGLSLLPSAFFTMEKNVNASGDIVDVTFFGGGNGHGVGMSQNGVRSLVDRGMNFREILMHYYPNTKIYVISS